MRFRFLHPDEMKGQPTIPINVPNNPANPLSYVVVPALLEIELQDPDDEMKTKWFDIPFHYPETPAFKIIESSVMPNRKRN
jgi:hypothetical protein